MRKFDSTHDLFVEHKISSVYELHAYEVLKLVIDATINDQHGILNDESSYHTRRKSKGLLNSLSVNSFAVENSVKNRAIKLFNHFKPLNVIPNVKNLSQTKINSQVHKIFDNYIFDNKSVMDLLFGGQ